MDVATLQVRPSEARALWLEYRKAVRSETDQRRRAEDQELTRAYRAIAQGGRVINVPAVIAQAGIDPQTFYPRLAWANATARVVRVSLGPQGRAYFGTRHSGSWHLTRRSRAHQLHVPDGSLPAWTWQARPTGWSSSAECAVPAIPPHLRPATSALEHYAIIWEATWTPIAPHDPLLVRMVGRSLAVIVGAWDLTELERAVMAARPVE